MVIRARDGRGSSEKSENPTWGERVRALRYVPPLLRLVWQTHRGYTAATVVLRLLRAFVPVAALWTGKLIVDAVVAARGAAAPDYAALWRLVLLEICIVLAGEALSRASSLVESLLGDLFSNHTSVRLMRHAATLDLYQFEDPAFYDGLERARRQTTGRIGLLAQLLSMGQDALTLASLAVALAAYNAWLLLLLVAAVLPGFWGETHFAALEYSLLYRWTPERRQLDYLRFLGASDRTAKEVQVFGLAPWLAERYRRLSEKFYEENKRLSIRRGVVATLLSFVGTLGYYAAYGLILLRAVQGQITIGALTFLAASFMRSRDLISRLLSGASDIYQQSLYLKDLFDFFEMKPTITSQPGAPPVPEVIREGFVFEDVGFQYPGGDKWAVRHVSFQLRPGERVALVGENGAGKTTLTKLLARLYDPTEGRITLDGRDLRDYDLESVRRAVSVIFQDFVRYDLRFDENIGVGGIAGVQSYLDAPARENGDGRAEKANTRGVKDKTKNPSARAATSPALSGDAAAKAAGGDLHGYADTNGGDGKRAGEIGRAASDARAGGETLDEIDRASDAGVPAPLVTAAEKSLAASLLPRFAERYRQMLGRRFDGGVDLSGGEWQKIALARAYMRDAQVLILDEPTAALDARAEYEVFKRFSELVTNRMAVIISHRFSTVRMADRIIVLEGGSIAEEGTHAELLARGGPYAELFTLQAEGYR